MTWLRSTLGELARHLCPAFVFRGQFLAVMRQRIHGGVKVPQVPSLARGAYDQPRFGHYLTFDKVIKRVRRHADIGGGSFTPDQARGKCRGRAACFGISLRYATRMTVTICRLPRIVVELRSVQLKAAYFSARRRSRQ